MRITVTCFGSLREVLPRGERTVALEVPAGSGIDAITGALGIPPGSVYLTLVDGEERANVRDGSEVTLMPPFSGGIDAHEACVLTVSDRAASGGYEDRSGPAAAGALEGLGIAVVDRLVVPDDATAIEDALRAGVQRNLRLIVTTGGTGLAERDVTPEATGKVIERDAPGLAELMRVANLERSPQAALSRGRTGIAARTLIVNLPGSPRGVEESLAALAPVLVHALDQLASRPSHHVAH
ncbi:MAG: molybdopterin-binding protein [Actinomycetota bacterium]|nr:molybdopterin-binding protein [Actinomycetota bacterium]